MTRMNYNRPIFQGRREYEPARPPKPSPLSNGIHDWCVYRPFGGFIRRLTSDEVEDYMGRRRKVQAEEVWLGRMSADFSKVTK